MSKSLGNVIDPFELLDEISPCSIRSYFLSTGPQFKDANFDKEDLIKHHNNFVLGSFVNLIYRCSTKKMLKHYENLKPIA